MTKSLTFLSVIFLFTLGSCKEEALPETTDKIDNHITFNIGTEVIEATYKVILQDELFNGYRVNNKTISLQRLVTNGSPERIIFAIERMDLINANLPITLKYSSNSSTPSVSVTYVNKDNMPFGTNLNNPDDFVLVINHYSDKVLNCTFNGALFSGNTSNPSVLLTNGQVNLELVEI